MNASTAAPSDGLGASPGSPRRRFWAWLSGAEALAAARQKLAQQPPHVSRALGTARALIRAADRIQESAGTEQEIGAISFACTSEAIRILASAGLGTPQTDTSLAEARSQLAELVSDPELVGGYFEELALREGSLRSRIGPVNPDLVLRSRELAGALEQSLSPGEGAVARLLWLRAARIAALILVLAAAIVGLTLAVHRALQGPDLAKGAEWKASSSYPGFDPATGICDGNATEIFFHTAHESEPYIEYDLGAPQQVSRISIQNRSDCCRERAVPLVVEVSLDGEQWQEVARKRESFRSVELDFAPVEARFVRLRATGKTWLHLEHVAIRGP